MFGEITVIVGDNGVCAFAHLVGKSVGLNHSSLDREECEPRNSSLMGLSNGGGARESVRLERVPLMILQ